MRYYHSVSINQKTITFRDEIDDPFVTVTVVVSIWDRLRSLFKKRFTVTVAVDGDKEAISHVMGGDFLGNAREDVSG